MRKKSSKLLLILSASAFLFQSCRNSEMEDHNQQAHATHQENQTVDQYLTVSPAKQVLSRQATIKLSKQSNTQTFKAQGYIDFDRNRFESVSARIGGRIEKLYVKYNLQYVKKGTPIMDLYSPELNTYQEEHLLLLNNKTASTLLEKSREKLRLLGMTQNQISELEKKGVTTQSVTIFSPADGYVFFEENKPVDKVSADSRTPMQGMDMNQGSPSKKSFAESGSQIREGAYVNSGQTLFSVNDLNTVWAVISVPLEFKGYLKANQPINIHSELFPDDTLSGKIALVEPAFEEGEQRFLRIRVPLNNTDKSLKLNSLLTAEIPFQGKQELQVPASAVYRTGLNAYVWLKIGTTKEGTGIFELRQVTIGSQINEMMSILNGLSADDEIAKEAGLLTDSETLLNSN